MTLSKKLAQRQLLKSRNEAHLSSLPVAAIDGAGSSLLASEPSTIESGLEKLRRRFRTPQPDQEPSSLSVSVEPRDTLAGALEGGTFLRHVSHSPFGLDDQQEAVWIRRLIQLLCAHGETADPRSVIFLDTETTGLSGGAGTVAFLVGVGRWSGSGFTRLVVELADLPGHPARALARRAKTATETWLADRLALARVKEPRERACEIMLLLEGSLALTLIHGQRRYFDAAGRAAKRLLSEKPMPGIKKKKPDREGSGPA